MTWEAKTPWLFVQKPKRAYLGTLERLEGTKDWWMEAKIDGWRCLVRFDGQREPTLWTRQGNKLQMPRNLWPQLQQLAKRVKPYTVFDSEIYNPQKRGNWVQHPEVLCKLELFDVLYENGLYAGLVPQINRRLLLEKLVEQSEDIRLARMLEVSKVNWADIWYLATKTPFITGTARPPSNWTNGFIHGCVFKQLAGKREDSNRGASKEVLAWMKITIPSQKVWMPNG